MLAFYILIETARNPNLSFARLGVVHKEVEGLLSTTPRSMGCDDVLTVISGISVVMEIISVVVVDESVVVSGVFVIISSDSVEITGLSS